jgi:hypothetical protein
MTGIFLIGSIRMFLYLRAAATGSELPHTDMKVMLRDVPVENITQGMTYASTNRIIGENYRMSFKLLNVGHCSTSTWRYV